jgi:hypothetical protein
MAFAWNRVASHLTCRFLMRGVGEGVGFSSGVSETGAPWQQIADSVVPARRATRFSINNLVCCPRLHRLESTAALKGEGQATMQASEVPRAMAAAMSTASSLDLTVDDVIVLHDSNKLTLRLLPCDVLARVAL